MPEKTVKADPRAAALERARVQGSAPDWVTIAKTDPTILAWFRQLTQGRIPVESMGAFLARKEQRYDYRRAIEAGLRPSLQQDGTYHWPDSTGRKGEPPLKLIGHPTAGTLSPEERRNMIGVPVPAGRRFPK